LVKKKIKIFIKTILIGLLGGIIFNLLLLPLPWMLGPAFSVAIFALSGVNVDISRNFRGPFVGLTGVWLGSYFQPSILNDVYIWMISLVFLVLYIPLAHLVSYYVLVKIRKINKPEAFFIGSAGGLLEMTLGAEECKADAKRVSLTHMSRIFFTVMFIPNLLLLFFPGAFEREPVWPNLEGNFLHIIAFIILIPLGQYIGKKINLPGYSFFGPLVITAILHFFGYFNLDANITFLIISQLIIGSFFGCNMNGVPWKVAKKYLIDAMVVVLSLTSCIVPFLFILGFFTLIKTEAILLAFSPGGINEMGLLAVFLNIEPAYVVTHHLFRLCTVLTMLIFAKKYLYPKFKKMKKIS
jgi:membrane AbrB-like protein